MSFEVWLDEIVVSLKSKVKKDLIERELIGHVHVVKGLPRSIKRLKKVRLPSGDEESHWESIMIEPKEISQESPSSPFDSWYEDQVPLDTYLGDITKDFHAERNTYITNRLLEDATLIPALGNKITDSDIRKALGKLSGKADTLVIHPTLEGELKIKRKIIPGRKSSESTVVGIHFSGSHGMLDVYWNPYLDESSALIYKKSDTSLQRTLIDIRFDNYYNPRKLILKDCLLVWAKDQTTIGKIVINDRF